MYKIYKKVIFEDYANFEGRARRKEYWQFTLMNFIILVSVIAIGGFLSLISQELFIIISTIIIILLYFVLTIIPTIAVAVRRLHDINKSGWFYLIQFIPFIGGLWFLFLMVLDGDYYPNQYGADPKNEFDEINEIGVESKW